MRPPESSPPIRPTGERAVPPWVADFNSWVREVTPCHWRTGDVSRRVIRSVQAETDPTAVVAAAEIGRVPVAARSVAVPGEDDPGPPAEDTSIV